MTPALPPLTQACCLGRRAQETVQRERVGPSGLPTKERTTEE